MAQPIPQTVVYIRKDKDDNIRVTEGTRNDYAPSLATILGVKIRWMDFTPIKSHLRSAVWEAKAIVMKKIRALNPDYAHYDMRGFTQAAKNGLGMLLHKDQPNPFPAPKDAVRWSLLTTPLYGGPDVPTYQTLVGKILVVSDHELGVGDGWGNIRNFPPCQIRGVFLAGDKAPTKWDLDRAIILKGMAMHHDAIPEGYIARLPVSCLKGQGAKSLKPNDTIEGHLLIGVKTQAGRMRRSRLGYMGVMGFGETVFSAMEPETLKAIEMVKAFAEDPLTHLGKMDLPEWLAPEEYPEGEEPTEAEEPESRMAILEWIGWLFKRTGDKRLLKSKYVAEMVQDAISMKMVSSILHGGADTWMGYVAPPQRPEHHKDECVYLHPSDADKFSGRVIAKRDPILETDAIRALRVVVDDSIPAGIIVMTPTTFAIMRGDFDGDTAALTNVVDTNPPHWTEIVWDQQAKIPNLVTEKIRTTAEAAPLKNTDEAFCKALQINVGGPTNVVIMLEALKQIQKPKYEATTIELQQRAAEATQIAVDTIKKGGEQDTEILKLGAKHFALAGGAPTDWGWAHSFKAGSKVRPWSLDKEGNVRPVIAISNRTALGAHILRHKNDGPEPMKEILSNAHFRTWIKPRPGKGFAEAQKAWQDYGQALAAIAARQTEYGAMKLERQALSRAWKDMWLTYNATQSREWMESAISGLWQLAWEDEANQARLYGTNLPVIFGLIAEDWGSVIEAPGITGVLLGIGEKQIGKDGVTIKALSVRTAKDAHGVECQYIVTAENPNGWKVINAFLPTGITDFDLVLKPKSAKSATFEVK